MFLLRGALFRAGSLFDVDYQFALRLVLVNWSGRIVDFIVLVRVPFSASSPSRRPPGRAESVSGHGGLLGGLHRNNKETGMVGVTNLDVENPVHRGAVWVWGLGPIRLVIVGIHG